MTGRLRVGVIGCGFYADNHLHSWCDLADDIELVAVCDRDPARARRAQRMFTVPAQYTDAEEMLREEKLDFVDIVTTMPTHKPLVLLAARHNLAAIVQKPFAATYAECVEMVEAMEAAGRPLMVHENFRFQSAMLAIRQILDQGAIGPVTWARISWRTGYDIYAGQPYLKTEKRFILLDIGVHVVDLARALMGEIDHIACQTQNIKPGIAGEDMATMMVRFANGATGIIDCSYATRREPDTFPEALIEIEGRSGSLALLPGQILRLTSNGSTTERSLKRPLLPWTTEEWHVSQESVLNTQRHWLNCWRNGMTPETSGRDSLKTYALIEAAYESAATGRTLRPAFLRSVAG